jgi:uncharacterized protein YndB with AHSA1/START domain
MAPRDAHAKIAGISSAAVEAKTGKGWAQWFRLLDQHGARRRKHKDIAALLHNELGCSAWWSQMITVGYEQAHGMREKHEKPDGYQISRSKTLDVPVAELFAAWNKPALRCRWLSEDGFTIRKSTANKSIRMLWADGTTTVEVMFYAKGPAKCQVTVQHNKLPSAKEGERMKAYWGKMLERLADVIE